MTIEDVGDYLNQLISNNAPPLLRYKLEKQFIDRALERTEYCFNHIQKPYYYMDKQSCFDPLHSDHFASLMWFVSNELYREGHEEKAAIIFTVNKRMHGIDMFYSLKLPNIFLLVHPIGTILGNAEYEDYFVCYQGCTIGSDGTGYPVFKGPAVVYSNSSIIGKCSIGSNVVVGARSILINDSVKNDKTVVGGPKKIRVWENKISIKSQVFGYHD